MKPQNQLSRRDFIKIGGLAAAMAALSSCTAFPPTTTHSQVIATPTPVSPTAAAPTLTAAPVSNYLVTRTLKRITFGLRPEDIARANEIGLDNFIDEQLAPSSISDTDLEGKLGQLSTMDMAPTDLTSVSPRKKPGLELSQATLLRAVYSHRQLNELMVDFWTNHFNINLAKDTDRYLKTVDDREVIRPNALGKFHELLSASMHSPAMLVYLDNARSSRNIPNENYARELMELHTLGVTGGYSQVDVTEVARALTGWTVEGLKGAHSTFFLYDPRIHDDGEKHILGQIFPAGQGIRDGEKVAELLANHPATAGFISAKLIRRFVSDDPQPGLAARATAAFTSSQGDLAKVMGTILHSDEFRASFNQKVKRPFEFVVSALRAMDARVSPGLQLLNFLTSMGQPLFRWESPNGFPDSAGAWATTNGMLTRWNFALALASNSIKESPVELSGLVSPGDPAELVVDKLSEALIGEPVSDQAKSILMQLATTANTNQSLPALTALLVASPFFQYR
jgi:uncharacterized protein (DUF1800 family)